MAAAVPLPRGGSARPAGTSGSARTSSVPRPARGWWSAGRCGTSSRRSSTTPRVVPLFQRPRWTARSGVPKGPRASSPARWARCWPSGPRPPASAKWSSTVAATGTPGGSPPWPRPPAKPDSSSRRETHLMPGQQRRGGGSGSAEGGGGRRDNRREGGRGNAPAEKTPHLERVVKGGRRFSFTALVVVGDGDGTVGVGYGKAKEVPAAIAKGVEEAKKHFFKVPRIGSSIPHPVQGEDAGGVVLLKPASAGTGVIAGGPVRAVLECAGIHDVLS